MSKEFLFISTANSETKVVAELGLTNRILINSLLEKMTVLMRRLQAKIQGRLEDLPYSKTGKLRDSIANPRAEIESGNIVGRLDWGKTAISEDGFNYALAFEEGIQRPYVIYPLGKSGTKGFYDAKGHWKTSHGKNRFVRFGANKLHFFSNNVGKMVFASYARHDAVSGRHVIKTSVDEFEDDIRKGLFATVNEVLTKKKKGSI